VITWDTIHDGIGHRKYTVGLKITSVISELLDKIYKIYFIEPVNMKVNRSAIVPETIVVAVVANDS